MKFLHFSTNPLPQGTVLEPRGRFFAHDAVEAVLESVRPSSSPPRRSSVFLMEEAAIDDACRFGLAPFGAVYEAEPTEPPTRHDAAWVGLIQQIHASRDFFVKPVLPVAWGDEAGLADLARRYWAGDPCPHRGPLWEFAASGAVIGQQIATYERGKRVIVISEDESGDDRQDDFSPR